MRYDRWTGTLSKSCDTIIGVDEAAQVMGDRYVSPAGNDSNTGRTRGDPFATLQKGVNEIAAEGGGTLYLALGTYHQNTSLVGPQYSGITIVGDKIPEPDPEFPHKDDCDLRVRVDGGARGPVFVVANAERVVFRDLTIENGFAIQGGGILARESQIDIEDCCIRRNRTVSGGGGGISIDQCRTGLVCAIRRSKIYANRALAGPGGGVRIVRTENVVIENCDIYGNVAQDGNGGGVAIGYGKGIRIVDSHIFQNVARHVPGVVGAIRFFKGAGGGVYAARCADGPNSVAIEDCRFTANEAGFGGGISIQRKAYLRIDKCHFVDNRASEDGGGVFVGQMDPLDVYFGSVSLDGDLKAGKLVQVQRCIFKINSAGDDGGGVSTTGGSVLSLVACRFYMNNASSNGGAVSATWMSWVIVQGGRMVQNVAGLTGGGLSARNSQVVIFRRVLIQKNFAGTNGGGIALYTRPESSATFYDFNKFMLRSNYVRSQALIHRSNMIDGNVAGLTSVTCAGGGVFAAVDRGGHPLSVRVEANRVVANVVLGVQGKGADMYFEAVDVNPTTPALIAQKNPPATAQTIIVT